MDKDATDVRIDSELPPVDQKQVIPVYEQWCIICEYHSIVHTMFCGWFGVPAFLIRWFIRTCAITDFGFIIYLTGKEGVETSNGAYATLILVLVYLTKELLTNLEIKLEKHKKAAENWEAMHCDLIEDIRRSTPEQIHLASGEAWKSIKLLEHTHVLPTIFLRTIGREARTTEGMFAFNNRWRKDVVTSSSVLPTIQRSSSISASPPPNSPRRYRTGFPIYSADGGSSEGDLPYMSPLRHSLRDVAIPRVNVNFAHVSDGSSDDGGGISLSTFSRSTTTTTKQHQEP